MPEGSEPPLASVVIAGRDGGASTGLRQLTGLVKKLRVISISLGTRFIICGSAPQNKMFSVLASK